MIDINAILSDRKKAWSIVSFLILGAFAFVLLIKHDFGNFYRLRLAVSDREYNKAVLDSLGEHKRYLKEFNAVLAPDNSADRLMGILTITAKSSGVILSSVKPLEVERSSGYNVVKVSIEGASSYRNLLGLIRGVEGDKECVFIDSISIKPFKVFNERTAENFPADRVEIALRDEPVNFKAVIASVAKEM